MKATTCGVILAMLTVFSAAVQSAAYPEKPIKMIVGFAHGGPTDGVARYLAPKLAKSLGQQVVVENKPGASGILAAVFIKEAAPDGYVLNFVSGGTIAVAPVYNESVPFDVFKDFTMIGGIAAYPNVVVVPPSSPFKTLADLINTARKKPGTVTFASAGVGSSNHLATEQFAAATGIKLSHVPYKGDSPMMSDLYSGRVDVAFINLLSTKPGIKDGRLRALALSTPSPSPLAPGVPTVAQEANIPGYYAETWNGMMAPAGLSLTIRNRLNAELNKILGSDDTKAWLFNMGQRPFITTPEEFTNHVKSETARWRSLVDAGVIQKGN